MSQITILDLDNCISDDGWRIPAIDWSQQDKTRRYARYHALGAFDRPANHDLWEALGPESCVVITARPESVRHQTEHWLRHVARVPLFELIMRKENDHRATVKVKEQALLDFMERWELPAHAIAAAYDDRQDVVDMYLKHNVAAYRRAVHSVCAGTPPSPQLELPI